MMVQGILFPLFVQVALTFGLLFGMSGLRTRDVTSGKVDRRNIALREARWPPYTTQWMYAFANEFEIPVLFYVLVCLLIPLRHADLVFVVLAWLFVLARVIRAAIHITNNDVRMRGMAFGASAVILAIMWVIFAVEIFTGT